MRRITNNFQHLRGESREEAVIFHICVTTACKESLHSF